MLLEGRTAIVTGSSKGIGRAYAHALAREGAGVVVNGTSAADVDRVVAEIRAGGGRATGCVESVATMAGAGRIVQSALDSFGRLDILVNNAGMLRDRTLLKMTEEEWDEVIAVHLKGTFACAQAAAMVMSQQMSGCIINTSSHSVWGNIGQCNYSAAKAGILGFTFSAARELSRYNIRVNAVAPRALTAMTLPRLEASLKSAGEEAKRRNAPEPTALDIGWGEPDMVAPLIVFLASDDARDITGAFFRARGESIAVWSRNLEIASATMPGGWTVEELRKRFWPSLGRALATSWSAEGI